MLQSIACSNVSSKVHALYLRWSDPDSPYLTGVSETGLEDVRGVCTVGIETAQTFLAPDEAAMLVEEYVGGATRKTLAVKYGIHEQTVGAHVHRAGAKRPARVTPEVLAEYAQGVPATVLAQKCGVTDETITRHARLAGITPGPRQCPPEQITGIISSYAAGERIVDIGKRFRIGSRRVRAVLVDAGVEIRPRGHKPRLADRRAEVMRLRGQGWSYARIGDRLGVNASTVRDAVIRWEIV